MMDTMRILDPPGPNSSCEPVMSQLKMWVKHELSVSYTPVVCELYGKQNVSYMVIKANTITYSIPYMVII